MIVQDRFERIGHQVRDARVKANLTQTELSRLSGVGLNTISLLERAERDVRLSSLLQLAEALNCVLDFAPRRQGSSISKDAPAIRGYDLDD